MPQWMFWMPSDATWHSLLWFSLTLWGVHVFTSLGASAFFHWMHRREILPHQRVAAGAEPSAALRRAAWRERALGHPVLLLLTGMVVYPLFVWTGGNLSSPLPTPGMLILQLLGCAIINDTVFYWSHRCLHHRRLFRLIHRQHHTFRHVRPVSSEYAHPVENLFNLIALYAGPLLLGCPFPVWVIWVFLRIVETCDAHSGYQFDPIASKHAFHHLHPTKGCYGTGLGLWDGLMRTDRDWREAQVL